MGCIFSLIGSFIEIVYEELMCMIIPEWKMDEKTRHGLEFAVTLFSVMLFFCIGIGVILYFNKDSGLQSASPYFIKIPLIIIVTQIALGIVVRILKRKKNK